MADSKRGKAPDLFTRLKLCAITGGCCQFCNKFLFTDNVSLADNNDSNLAHIIASSPDGPRGSEEESHQLSDKIENLMLMCQEHHHLIDNNPQEYTVEFLRNLKKQREDLFSHYSDMQNLPKTNIVVFRSAIKGIQHVNYNLQEIMKAFLLEKIPEDSNGIDMEICAIGEYETKKYWEELLKDLEYKFETKIKRRLERSPEAHFSIFPLAPIPLIIKFGTLLGDKITADVYQKFRSPDSWAWQSRGEANSFFVEKKKISGKEGIALVIALTADIDDNRVIKANDQIGIIYKISSKKHGVDCIKTIQDLNSFWHTYQETCEAIVKHNINKKAINVFPAMPVSAAFEFGRRYMYGVYPQMLIYDDRDGFFETIIIGG